MGNECAEEQSGGLTAIQRFDNGFVVDLTLNNGPGLVLYDDHAWRMWRPLASRLCGDWSSSS